MTPAARLACAVLLVASAGASSAKDAVPAAADPASEARVMRIAEELRCLVCQNESLAGSRAELALDLKQQIREQVKAGRTDEQVAGFMVERYGDFVRYRPPFKASTALLWLGPFLLLFGIVFGLFIYIRRRRNAPAQSELSADERARAEALLADEREERA
jgi:cytochrome c-type biogenesis protein CcmH